MFKGFDFYEYEEVELNLVYIDSIKNKQIFDFITQFYPNIILDGTEQITKEEQRILINNKLDNL